ncbi:hypothetical protein HCN44_000343 [Aphidius gifuensis]|uniref:MULE transposase domain-containing protein n=1 Tax=Aphidius gifuensis TaxID=684658 RepID=A0A834XNF4_APHGI|nr:hypothetical protein HCN44_000343 [Aphidius gifuensis]
MEIPICNLIELNGQLPGSKIFICDNKKYHRDTRGGHTFRCARRKLESCSAQLSIINDKLFLINSHTCATNKNILIEDNKIREEVKFFAKKTYQSPGQIYSNTVMDRLANSEVQETSVNKNVVRNITSRERLKAWSPVPHTYDAFDNKILEFPGFANIYKGRLLPSKPKFTQLLTVTWNRGNHGITISYILANRKCAFLYEQILNKLKEIFTGLEDKVDKIVSDFEPGMISSLRKAFPNAVLTGCSFHFDQATKRGWKRWRLNDAPTSALFKIWTLPLIPPDLWNEALDIIEAELDELIPDFPGAAMFKNYLRKWEKLSGVVYSGTSVKANNIAESSNRWTFNRFGSQKNQSSYMFLS